VHLLPGTCANICLFGNNLFVYCIELNFFLCSVCIWHTKTVLLLLRTSQAYRLLLLCKWSFEISSCVPHDGHLLVNLVKKLNLGDRRTCELFLYASSDCFNGGKTPGRLVWSFCNANISSWRSTGLHLLLLQRYNHVLQSILNDFDLCDVFYKVISDTETVDCPELLTHPPINAIANSSFCF